MTRANISDASALDTRSKLQLVRKPSDWMAGSGHGLVRHVPTKTVFEIFPRPGMRADEIPTPGDLRAGLVRVGEGVAPPTLASLDLLCGEAALMAFFLLGFAWLRR